MGDCADAFVEGYAVDVDGTCYGRCNIAVPVGPK